MMPLSLTHPLADSQAYTANLMLKGSPPGRSSRKFELRKTAIGKIRYNVPMMNTMATPKALVVEDDVETANFVASGLIDRGFACDCATSGVDGLRLISEKPYEIAIVDVALDGDFTGLDLIKDARQRGVNTPIIVLSSFNHAADKIVGLKCGADDYLGKPFARDELLARVEAQIRRSGSVRAAKVLKAHDITLCPETREVRRVQQPISLTSGEYALLELLMRNMNRTISFRAILQNVWNTDYVPSSKVVETRVCSLRKKL